MDSNLTYNLHKLATYSLLSALTNVFSGHFIEKRFISRFDSNSTTTTAAETRVEPNAARNRNERALPPYQ